MLSHFLTDRKSSLKSQGREINNDLVTPHRPVQPWNSRAVHNRASTPAPISETFGRSQETSASSNVEQNCKTDGLENFRKNLVEKELLTFAGRFHEICCLDMLHGEDCFIIQILFFKVNKELEKRESSSMSAT